MLADFSRNYVAYLLPALLEVSIVGSCRGIKSQEMEKLVRSEVDMALALSASGCAWGRALRQKLEQGVNTRKLHKSPTKQPVPPALPFSTCNQNNALNYVIFTQLWTAPFIIARPLPPISSPMTAKRSFRLRKARKPPKRDRSTLSSRRSTVPRGDEELHHRVRSLRSVLPGGSEMGVHELLSEVGSYVMCLELQVSILRCLLK